MTRPGSRGIFHCKNEPLTTSGYNRLHIIFGESLCSELALWLKVGTTALVVGMIDAGLCPGDEVTLANPLEALRLFATDPTCRVRAQGKNGVALSALAIQRRYLELAEANLGQDFMPEWAPQVCAEWRSVLSQLESGPDAVATQLDWAIKFALFSERIERHGFTWEQIAVWNQALEAPTQAPRLDPDELGLDDDEVSASPVPPSVDTERLRRFGLAPEDLDRFAALRAELFEIDVRFGELGADGIFNSLSEAGVLRHQRVDGATVATAIESPPSGGRAALRGDNVRRLNQESKQPNRYVCDWDAIVDQQERKCLDLNDPFAAEASWREVDELEVVRFELGLFPREHHPLSVVRHLCRIGQYFEAAPSIHRTLEQVGDPDTILSIRLLEATSARHLGDNDHARTLLKRVADTALMRERRETYLVAASHLVLADLANNGTRRGLQKAIVGIERRLRGDDTLRQSSRLTLLRSQVELAAGSFDAALDLARHALERSRLEGDSFDRELHHQTILTCLIQLGRIDELEAHLRSPGHRRQSLRMQALFDAANAHLHRRRGAHREAMHWARAALRKSRRGQNQAEQVFIKGLALKAYLAAGRFEDADQLIEYLYRYRSSEVAEHRFIGDALLGDLELARAQSLGSLADDGTITIPRDARREAASLARRADRRYGRAATSGGFIDRRLCCNWRSEYVEKKRVAVAAVREAAAD